MTKNYLCLFKMNLKIPIIIISYNRLSYLKDLVEYFLNLNEKEIYILDNKSTYKPLLEWFEKIEKNENVKVIKCDINHGHRVYWNVGFYSKINDCKYCIITDHDILPYRNFEEGWKEKWVDMLEKHGVEKVGSAISIDDIPDEYIFKNHVINHEKNFWQSEHEIEKNCFNNQIDTTLYLQRIHTSHTYFRSIRMADYLIKHRPWYINPNNLTEEDVYYYNSISERSTSWSYRIQHFTKEI